MRRLLSILAVLLISILVSSCDVDWFKKTLPDTLWQGDYDGYYVEVSFGWKHSGKIKVANAKWKFKYDEDDNTVLITLSSETQPSLKGEFDDYDMFLHGLSSSSLFGTDEVHLVVSTEYEENSYYN